MQDGVRRSEAFVCILSEGYFESEYCCKEMRWAFENEKPILSTFKNGMNVGALLNTAPEDFRDQIKTVDSISIDASANDGLETSGDKADQARREDSSRREDLLESQLRGRGGTGGRPAAKLFLDVQREGRV